MTWQTITFRGEDFHLGDDIIVTVSPGPVAYQGFLNVIERNYIVLTGTGFTPVQGFGSQLGFPLNSIQTIERIGDSHY